MAEVMEGSVAGSVVPVPSAGVDWHKRCLALEMQLLRFRLQAGKIRQLLAEKMQELEQRVSEADRRADGAEKQVQIMEEKLKSANVLPGESESSLYRRYQELITQLQEKDTAIKRLEAQLEKQSLVRAQEAKIIEEKAAKIKDWVTFKLREMEMENQQLKVANVKQAEHILLLQDKLQTLLERPTSPGSPRSPAADVHLVPSSPLHPPSCPGTPPMQDEGWKSTGLPVPNSAPNGKGKPLECSDSIFQNALKHSQLNHRGDSILKLCPDRDDAEGIAVVTEGRKEPGASAAVTRKRVAGGASDRDHSSDELNSKFRSQRLRSSSSSSSSSSSTYETSGPGGFDPPVTTPKSPPPPQARAWL